MQAETFLKREEEKVERNYLLNVLKDRSQWSFFVSRGIEAGGHMSYESIKKTSEFSKVYKHGKSYADRHLVMYVYPNKLGYSRLGLSISKKVGKSVVRNRIRRLIKEVFRLNYKSENHNDIVIIARVRASEAGYMEIKKSFRYLLKKAGI